MKLHGIFIGLLIGLAAVPAGASARILIRVSPAVCFAPANMVVRATLDRDAANRAIEIIAESPQFYRSSSMELDGDRAPRVATFEFRGLPSGTYDVTARLLDSEGRSRGQVSQTINVISSGADSGR